MTVRFEFTLDDLLDVVDRTQRKQRAHRVQLVYDLSISLVLAGLGAFVVIITGRAGQVLPWIYVAGVMLGEYVLNRIWRRARLRSDLRKQVNGDGPFECIVDIDAAGLHIQQFGFTVTHTWSDLAAVDDKRGGIEFVTKGGSITAVRDRAFDTHASRAIFLASAQGLHAAHGG